MTDDIISAAQELVDRKWENLTGMAILKLPNIPGSRLYLFQLAF